MGGSVKNFLTAAPQQRQQTIQTARELGMAVVPVTLFSIA